MKRFSRILLYVGTEEIDAAMNRSVQLALENNASLTLMGVVKPVPHGVGMITDLAAPEDLERLVVEEARDRLMRLAADYSDTGVPLEIVVTVGKPAVEIVRQVIRENHDLVVKTAGGRRPVTRLFGSVTTALMRTCPCPVWALKPEMHGEFDCVLAAVDPEAEDEEHRDLNNEILELSFAICRRENAVLHLVGVWDLWMEQSLRNRIGNKQVDAYLADRQQELRAGFERLLQAYRSETDRVELHLPRGTPAQAIRAVADEVAADLMVMGTVCRTGIAGILIGNTAEQLLSEATCSVLAIKPSRFVSPIRLNHSNR